MLNSEDLQPTIAADDVVTGLVQRYFRELSLLLESTLEYHITNSKREK